MQQQTPTLADLAAGTPLTEAIDPSATKQAHPDGRISVLLAMDFSDVLERCADEVNDLVSHRITDGAGDLTDIVLTPVGVHETGHLLIQVTADASDWLASALCREDSEPCFERADGDDSYGGYCGHHADIHYGGDGPGA